MIFRELYEDAKSICDRDPAARNPAEVILLYPGFRALVDHRVAHWLYKKKRFFLARWVSQHSRKRTGIEIHPGAEIGRRLFIDHGMGVVIGETAVVGDDCTIYHTATLGGTGKDTGKRHPTIGNNVLVATGAKVLGPFEVGDDARIGANAVVLSPVEPASTVVGVPGKTVRNDHGRSKPAQTLDQVGLPDPVVQELNELRRRVTELENALREKEESGR